MVSMSLLTGQWTSWAHTAICSANPGWSSLPPHVWSASLPPSWFFSASSSLSSCLAYLGKPDPKWLLWWPAAAATLVAAEICGTGPNPPHLLPRCWCPCLRLHVPADDRTIRWDLLALSLHSCDSRWAQGHVLHPAECGLICFLAMRQGFDAHQLWSPHHSRCPFSSGLTAKKPFLLMPARTQLSSWFLSIMICMAWSMHDATSFKLIL